MRQAVVALDQVSRDDHPTLEAFILRCDSVPPRVALKLEAWVHPERALRLTLRLVDAGAFPLSEVVPDIEAALQSPRLALFRQSLRAVGRYALADLIELALADPRILETPGLHRIAAESAAKCAGANAVAARWVQAQGGEHAKARLMARREQLRAEAQPWTIPPTAKWLAGVHLCLRFKEGMHDWVLREVKSQPGISLLKIGRGMIWLSCDADRPYAEILGWRTVLDHAFALPVPDLVQLAQSPQMQAQLKSIFGEAAISFRVARSEKGRARSWEDGAKVMQQWEALVNEPRQSHLELSIFEDGPVRYALARPRLRERDVRFSYRVAEIPAASHPTVAAGLVAAANPGRHDRVWDPFAGSGLELIEAGLRGGCELLLGTDLDADALAGAKANAAAAGVDLCLKQADAQRVDLPRLTKVISNPPHGRRVAQNQDLAALYQGVLRQALSALVPGGEIHWLVVQPQWVHELCDAQRAQRDVLGRIDLGGIVVHYQRIIKASR